MKERGCGPAMTWSSTSEASICPGAPANCWCAAIRERLAPRAAASLLRCVSLPYILQCQGQGLCLHAAVAVHSVLRKDKLVRIPLGGQSLGHALIGEDRVVRVSRVMKMSRSLTCIQMRSGFFGLLRMRVSWNSHAPCGVSG